MSGTQLTYNFPFQAIQQHLERISAVDSTGFEAARHEIGMYFKERVREAIDSQQLFDGTPMPKSKAAIERGGKTLSASRILYKSYTYNLVGRGDLEIGSGMEYAAIHHFGGPAMAWGKHPFTMVARPVLGVTKEDKLEIGQIMIDDLKRTLRR